MFIRKRFAVPPPNICLSENASRFRRPFDLRKICTASGREATFQGFVVDQQTRKYARRQGEKLKFNDFRGVKRSENKHGVEARN